MDVQEAIEQLVGQAEAARIKFLEYSQEQVDAIVKQMTLAGVEQHAELARLAVEDTGRGIYEDKCIKNLFATEEIYHSIKYKPTVGIIAENEEEDFYEVAEPVGILAGLTPVTNPTSTVMFKSIISLKARNPIIFSFHPGALRCSVAAARLMLEAALAAGAPEGCISWVAEPSLEATKALIEHPGVALILATGGAAMVESAYSTGKPALGVGPGNVPCYIEKTAHVKRAVNDLIISKTFDNGMICASEQAVIVDREISDQVKERLQQYGCYFANQEDIRKLERFATDEGKCSLNADIVGRSAVEIAEMAEIQVPPQTKILIVPLQGVGPEYPLSREKLSPVLAYYEVETTEEGLTRCEQMLDFGGLGHTAVIHSEDEEVIRQYSTRMKTGRIIVNSPSSQGAIGDLYNSNMPSLTLGCGTMGRNSTTSNVSTANLINVKRVARRRVKMQWFRVPERIYFESGSIGYISKMPNIQRAMVVTDEQMIKLGYVDKVLYHLRKRENQVVVDVFSDILPDPTLDMVIKGYEAMKNFHPDTIIALGGGSVIDAAKGMWLYYEYPDIDFEALRLKFLNIRGRAFKYPKLGRKARLVAIPTTSGTGSEVTAFAVITDREREVKYPLADYELTPDVAIIDFDFVKTVPQPVIADTGVDVLTHAMEAYVSVMASDYTDGLALKAIELVFRYLPRSFRNSEDYEAREKMHNASTIAGMAFTNAFLGINHSMAHQLGAEFHIPHGRANAVLMPHVIRYNSQMPGKLATFPKYEYFKAPERYQEIASFLNLPAATPEEGVNSLIEAVIRLMTELSLPTTISDCGVKEKDFVARIPAMAEKAFEDQTTISNPRSPLVSEMEELYRRAYFGE